MTLTADFDTGPLADRLQAKNTVRVADVNKSK
jgi:hypothetical protein